MELDCLAVTDTYVESKRRLRAAIADGRPLDVAKISRTDCCDLGGWLRGEARERYGHLSAYAQCVGAHANFHREAGKLAELVNERRMPEIEEALSPTSAFEIASYRLKSAIWALSRDASIDCRPAGELAAAS